MQFCYIKFHSNKDCCNPLASVGKNNNFQNIFNVYYWSCYSLIISCIDLFSDRQFQFSFFHSKTFFSFIIKLQNYIKMGDFLRGFVRKDTKEEVLSVLLIKLADLRTSITGV